MKKLMMFAAAMTIVGGAFAECEIPEITGTCALVYNVKMNLRTVYGKASSGQIANAATCEVDEFTACIRYPNLKYSVQGYLFTCDCECDAITEANSVLGGVNIKSALWVDEWEWELLHVLGNQTKAEAYWTLTGADSKMGPLTLTGAGFGSYSKKSSLFTSFSGTVVGQLLEPKCVAACEDAYYFWCGTLEEDNTEASIIYGTWGMKLNSSYSKAYAKNQNLPATALPAWYYSELALMDVEIEVEEP